MWPQILHPEVIIGGAIVTADNVIPGHIGSVLLPDTHQLFSVPFLYLQPLSLSMGSGGWTKLLVTEDMFPRGRIAGVNQAMAPYSGAIVLQGRKLLQPSPIAFLGYVHRVVILCQSKIETIIYIRIKGGSFILWSLVYGKGIPHQAAEIGLQKLHTPRYPLGYILSAYQIEAKLLWAQGAYHQLSSPNFSTVSEADACGSSIFYDDLVYLSVGEELAPIGD
jgi:hypothetical protein